MMKSYSSRIRPLPPRPNLKASEIAFGLCVDVFIENAWREGVLVGRKRDFSTMLVFFPETSDEILVPVSEIRLTQEWNEVFGYWRHRGLWIFLEIIKKFQQKRYVLSEIKKMWSQLKGTDTFREKIKIWYSGPKLIWNELVLDVIRGTKSATESSSTVYQSSQCWTHERVGKCCSTTSKKLLEVKNIYTRKRKHTRPHGLDSGEKLLSGVESDRKMEKVDGQEEDEKVRNNNVDGKIVLSSACDIKFTLENKKDGTHLVASRAWKPMELEGEYYHDLLELSWSSPAKLRKHLVSIGWRIESKQDTQLRFRYISVEQRIYYSLRKVFQYLLEKTKMRDEVRDMDNPKDIESDNNLVDISPPKADFVPLNHDKIKLPIDAELSKSLYLSECVIKAYVDHIKMSKGKSKRSSVFVKELRSKTKDYLLKKGWKFWLYDKKVRKELRYTSPNGRTYISLYVACMGYLEEAHCENTKRGRKSRKVGLEQTHLSSSNFSNSGQFDFKKHLGKKREPKRRKTEYPNIHMSPDEQLQNNYCDHKRTVKIEAFGASSRHKPFIKSFTSRVHHSGKRSRWDMFLSSKEQVGKTLLSWLIHKDVVLPRQKVAFFRQTDGCLLKEGWITQDGIKCRCCLNVFPISRFGAHVGSRTSRLSTSIILQDGRSLLDCQKQILSAFKPNKYQHARLRSDYSNHEGDDICTVCGDGGFIILCDLCPSAFHPACIGLEDVPEGQWFCPSCQCSICGLCEFNYNTENFTQSSGIYCDQCERQYHVRCLQNQGLLLKERPTGTWTCSKACSKINSCLQLFLGKSNPTNVKGLHWTILRSNTEHVGKFDDESIVEHSTMLHIALDVLHECFQTMIEPRTQSDLAADIIFNSTCELNRLNFGGFYTMLLMCEDELISVATFRIFGERLAEMPFIGTRVKFRRQGMCRILMNELQQLLSSLGVERLLLPAVPELLKTWISSFGFTEITPSDRLQLLQHTLLTFQGTTLCQKFLKKSSISTF